MKKFMVLAVIVLMAGFGFAADKSKGKEKEKKTSVDSGIFGIYLNGKRIGSEKFTINQEMNEGILTAELIVGDGDNKAEQTAELRVANDGTLRSYKWRSIVPSHEESIVEPKDQFLVEHVMPADQKKRDVPYIIPLSTVILDDNFFSQREMLIWRYLATGCIPKDNQLHCGRSQFGILVPHQHATGSGTVELIGRDKVMVKGTERELNKVHVDVDGVHWVIWVDDPENHYKVIKMAIPSSNVEVWRE